MATAFKANARNGRYAVDEYRDGKMLRNVMIVDSRHEAEEIEGALCNAYDQGAADQRSGRYVRQDDEREDVAEGDKHLYKPPGAADR